MYDPAQTGEDGACPICGATEEDFLPPEQRHRLFARLSSFSHIVARLQWDATVIDLAPDAVAWPELEPERRQRLTTLLEVARMLTSELDLSEIVHQVLVRAIAVIPAADAGTLYLVDSSTGKLVATELTGVCAVGGELTTVGTEVDTEVGARVGTTAYQYDRARMPALRSIPMTP